MTPRNAAHVAIVGGGPAGLMAAEVLSEAGVAVDLYDSMPSVGRKFLLAGRGGLNLTHSEEGEDFLRRYGDRSEALRTAIAGFDSVAVRQWAEGLGIPTFVGTSGRVFPQDMKAAPLLRAWLHRLRARGVRIHVRHRFTGWTPEGALRFQAPTGETNVTADATVLALGGGSWPRLGSDGAWLPWLAGKGVAVAPLQPSNCGFDVAPTAPGRTGWSEHLRQRFAGQPVKPVAARFTDAAGREHRQQGEFVLTDTGIEGSLVYAFSAHLRDRIAGQGSATWQVDLLPQHTPAQVLAEVARPRGPRSLSTHLKSRLGLQGLKMALLHEVLTPQQLEDPVQLAAAIQALPIVLARPRPMAEAISTAGGVRFDALDRGQMLTALPGTFCAGEMLDWEAPTGGYLLTACMATGRTAAAGVLSWLAGREPGHSG
ncbi:TIGR03862 family flavoprotein [Ramlibacter pallidus]|uniref:TIGR03862 family flavoprotein n=1 Tax=Ramlibacter pallidus TaxID=2780087 RepID=A0ABR9S011_9BURK|nr:TIGR03862 family flavoprotein [Ramlibacter pallidus]MBE7366637.1 TIGR03862 family flavoprotein [Ramlibacter pallidus]